MHINSRPHAQATEFMDKNDFVTCTHAGTLAPHFSERLSLKTCKESDGGRSEHRKNDPSVINELHHRHRFFPRESRISRVPFP
jgi:hypothetical protein